MLKQMIVACALLPSMCSAQSGEWSYKLQYPSSQQGKSYALDLTYDKAKGMSFLKRNDLGLLYRPIDFFLDNQQHWDGKSTLAQLGMDFALTELTRHIRDPRWRSFTVDVIRFGLEMGDDQLNSRTFTRGKRTLEFKVEF